MGAYVNVHKPKEGERAPRKGRAYCRAWESLFKPNLASKAWP